MGVVGAPSSSLTCPKTEAFCPSMLVRPTVPSLQVNLTSKNEATLARNFQGLEKSLRPTFLFEKWGESGLPCMTHRL